MKRGDFHEVSHPKNTFKRSPIHIRPSKSLLSIEDIYKVSYPHTFNRLKMCMDRRLKRSLVHRRFSDGFISIKELQKVSSSKKVSYPKKFLKVLLSIEELCIRRRTSKGILFIEELLKVSYP